MIVVDASVVVEFLLGRSSTVQTITAELTGAPDEALHAPELVEPEVLNAPRGLDREGAISHAQADRAVSELDQLRLVHYPHAPFRERVWALRDNLSAYDAPYLAVAETLPEPTLFTSDAGLAANAVRTLGDRRVRHLSYARGSARAGSIDLTDSDARSPNLSDCSFRSTKRRNAIGSDSYV